MGIRERRAEFREYRRLCEVSEAGNRHVGGTSGEDVNPDRDWGKGGLRFASIE